MYQEKELKSSEIQSTKNNQKTGTIVPASIKKIIHNPPIQQNIDLRTQMRNPDHSYSYIPANRNFSNIVQREPMPIDTFMENQQEIYNKYFNPTAQNTIWRFTDKPNEEIGFTKTPVDVYDQVTGEKKRNKPLSFLHNINAMLATAMSGKGDPNILGYINNAANLCSINIPEAKEGLYKHGFIICVAAANELTLMETECVLGRFQDKASLEDPNSLEALASIIPGISIKPNPFKGKILGLDPVKSGERILGWNLTKDTGLSKDTYSDEKSKLTGLDEKAVEMYSQLIEQYPSERLSHMIGSERNTFHFLNTFFKKKDAEGK